MAKISHFFSMLILMAAALALPVSAAEVAHVQLSSQQVQFEPQVGYEHLVLTVSMPGGAVVRREFEAGQAPSSTSRAGARTAPTSTS